MEALRCRWFAPDGRRGMMLAPHWLERHASQRETAVTREF
jgi:hypothetical protein